MDTIVALRWTPPAVGRARAHPPSSCSATSLSAGPVIYLEAFFPLYIGRAIRREDIVAGLPVVRVIERKLQFGLEAVAVSGRE